MNHATIEQEILKELDRLPPELQRQVLEFTIGWSVAQERILMLFMYPKSERDDLTRKQLKILREIVEREYP
ncbi:hypothetical protein LM602_00835 [Candidatus Acetothermia bacterium]|nr:hypothetical protein [Candidatus Acetothermia bacterium]MCI2431090.1 hypothetical protein [Candidatus Acetothermia bacterium]MCI2435714.1 hypothetical protein [Candidatus Acetothermia bacterium]